MKLTIHQELGISETEIIINCAYVDTRLQHLIELIRQHSFSLVGYREEKEFQLPLEQIYFIDSVDGKTFLYLEKEVYSCRDTLAVLEKKLNHTSFVRVSKNCIINTDFLQSVRPLYNHRLEAFLESGETLIVTRNYIEVLKNKLKGENL